MLKLCEDIQRGHEETPVRFLVQLFYAAKSDYFSKQEYKYHTAHALMSPMELSAFAHIKEFFDEFKVDPARYYIMAFAMFGEGIYPNHLSAKVTQDKWLSDQRTVEIEPELNKEVLRNYKKSRLAELAKTWEISYKKASRIFGGLFRQG